MRHVRPYRVYKRELGHVRFVGSFHTFSDAERTARIVGGYVTARKQVWHEDSAAATLSHLHSAGNQ